MKISLLKLVALAACVASAMAGTIVPKGYSADASAAPASAMVDAKMPGVVAAAHQQLGSFWDKVKHDAEEAAKHLAEEEAKKLAEELAEKALEAAAAALLGSTHRPVLAPTADDLERVKIVHAVNAAKTTWTAGLNSRFLGRPMSAVKRQLGVKSVKKLPERERFVVSPDALPTNFDSRTQWPNCKTIQEVRDQSDCGSCWAFGAVEAASDRICIDTNGADQAHLSAEDMVGCCSACGYGCDGGDPGSAWEYLASTGIVTGGNYNDYSWCSAYSLPNCDHHVSGQYAPCGANEYPTPACPSACDSNSTYTTPFQNDAHIFNSSYSVSADPTQIQMEIMTNGPVEAAFTVYSDFEAYKSGVYQHTTGDELGGHAVKILGWGVDAATSTPYWLVANSWNVDWGEKGFFRILRGSDECGIEDSIVAGLYSGK